MISIKEILNNAKKKSEDKKKRENADYDNEFKPKDRKNGFPKDMSYAKRRFFEIIPGFLTWSLLLVPVIFAVFKWDRLFVLYLAYLAAYWTVRTFKFVYGVVAGVGRMKRDIAEDWMGKIQDDKKEAFEDLRFIYLCPVYAESLETLIPSFEAFANSDIGANKIDVVVAMEDRKKDLQIENFKKLEEMFGDKFGSMTYYIHPSGIPGEVVGVKGANLNWSMRHHVKKLKAEGKDISKYLLITCDSDLRPHAKYLSAIAYKYLTVENPKKKFYATAVHTFNNNLWRVPSLIRVHSVMLTLVILQNWVTDKKEKLIFSNEDLHTRDSFSSYVVNLETLHDLEYWDPEIANDDTAFYWNALVRTKGNFKSEEVYVPTYSDAVENENYFKTHKSFYKQQHRWGWGIVTVPVTLASVVGDKDFPLEKKLYMFKMIFDTQIWYLTVIFVITFGMNIMSFLNPNFLFTAYAYNLPKIFGYIFSAITLSNIPILIYRRKVMPVPTDWKWWRHLLDFLELILITVNMLTFAFLPFLQAQTEMMLGLTSMKRNFNITEKVKIEKYK